MCYRKFSDKCRDAAVLISVILIIPVLILPDIVYAEKIQPTVSLTANNREKISVKKFADVEMVLITGNKIQEYWISRYEVTQELYRSVTGTNPGYYKDDKNPVEQVSWYNAVEFCNKLSERAGFAVYYNIDKKRDDPENKNSGIRWMVTINRDADGFRLPTSEEWEYAARGGSSGKYFWGDEMNGDYCWYDGNSGGKTHPVGSKKPNAYGIFDICGNVQEWCFDWHPLFTGQYRVVRDGQFNFDAVEMQTERTDYRSPQFEFGFTGIRLVKNK
jgi:formylglycine-generating enzyme required for sulfatase activity